MVSDRAIRNMIVDCYNEHDDRGFCSVFYNPQTCHIRRFESPRYRMGGEVEAESILCQVSRADRRRFSRKTFAEQDACLDERMVAATAIKRLADKGAEF